jgi:hypothetical protein
MLLPLFLPDNTAASGTNHKKNESVTGESRFSLQRLRFCINGGLFTSG